MDFLTKAKCKFGALFTHFPCLARFIN